MSIPDSKRLHVMVGVLLDDAGRALIAQRIAGKPHAGAWEFPGGKLEAGEDRLAGLARELREELGITIDTPRPLIRVSHTYSYGEVLLDVWVIRRFAGIPKSLDGQMLRWCAQVDLECAGLLAADSPIIAALQLPELFSRTAPLLVGSLRGVRCRDCAEADAAVAGGADFVLLETPIPPSAVTQLCASLNVPIYVAGPGLEEAWALGATGLNEIP